MDTIERSARHRARFTDSLREAHRDGARTDAERGVDPSGYWAEAGCPGCCGE